VEEEGYLDASSDGTVFDHFDTYPTTKNIIAFANARVVGGMRFTEHSLVGTPPSEFFDFSPFIPASAGPIGSGSMLFVEQAYRHLWVSFYLQGMGYAWALSRGWSHVLAVVNPDTAHIALKSGYRALAGQMFDQKKRLAFVPVLLDMRDLDPRLLAFAQSHQVAEYWVDETPRSAAEQSLRVVPI
jgi:hypothetical protein